MTGSAAIADATPLPSGFLVGHHTDLDGWTGCTAIITPPGSVGAGEVRGGGPGTRESDLLSPATSTDGPEAVLMSGGSAFGLAAADGVMQWLAENGRGHPTPAGTVPLVSAAVIFDLMLGSPSARPDAAAGRAACESAQPHTQRGNVGAGTGATAGKLLGPDHWTKGGLGAATMMAGAATMTAIAAVNPVGDVIAADGTVLAGAWRDGAYQRTADLLAAGELPPIVAREHTTLVCLCSDARLTKTEAWIVARAMTAGVARAISPSATAFDGDATFVLASGAVDADPVVVGALAADVTSAAIRDGVLKATGAPACPAASER
jgi:L-aminopeptidase/D-esterase-like protein